MSTYQLTACESTGGGGGLERTHFFPRQLITPDDLTQDQIYFREKLRRHNRFLHGWGVVCGARVKKGSGDCEIVIEPGYILGPYGNEILIDNEVTVDLCHEGLDGNAISPCSDLLDPWCSNVRVNRQAGQTLYVAVRYAECQSRPVRVQTQGCGCDETECEYSRIRDSYAIKVLTNLPTTYSDPMPQPSGEGITRCTVSENGEIQARLCPECPSEPWVILADVVLGDDGSVANINCFAHRRYVVSFADYYFLCRPPQKPELKQLDTLVDRVAEAAGEQPAAALVSAVRADGSRVYIPAHFTVEAGETMASFLSREGSRELHDPTTGETYTLAELYAMTEIDPQSTIRGIADVLVPLEGLTLRLESLRRTRNRLEALLDSRGIRRLDQEHAGAPALAGELLANDIRGIGPRSSLGQRLSTMTIAEAASLDRETFMSRVLEDVTDERQRARIERQAGEVWNLATEVSSLSRDWHRG